MRQTIFIFGTLSIAILLLFELSKLATWRSSNFSEFLLVLSGLSFIVVGYTMHTLLAKQPPNQNLKSPAKSPLSNQEHKILLLMSDGLSNLEIAKTLYITESTVKTHVHHIFVKLKAKRRTEAIKIGRDLNIV